LTDQVRSLEAAIQNDVDALAGRLRSVEGKVIALETAHASLRETVRETVRDTMRAELAEHRARVAEDEMRRARPELGPG
jgi:hypothetical protein